MYSSDFGSADATFTPVDGPLFLGLPPLLALMLLLLVLAIAAGMYFLGRWHVEQADGSDSRRAPREIYKVIRRYAADARSASSNELKQKAEVLVRKIDEYLGPVILIGRDMASLTKALKHAGDGKIEEPEKPGTNTEGRSDTPTCRCGGGGTPKGCVCASQPLSINQIYIGGVPVGGAHDGCPQPQAPHAKPEDKAGPPRTAKRDMTHPEQIDALDKAVRAFNDYWLDEASRVAELEAAQKALNRRPASRDHTASGGSSAGGHH